MKQIGAFPVSQLAALEETTQAVRRLIRGEQVTLHGQHVHIDNVKLEFPPEIVPPVQLGVRGVKSLMLSGRSADGTILAEGAAPAYIKWARSQIAKGQAEVGRDSPHRITIYVWTSIDDDKTRARAILRPTIARTLPHIAQQLEPTGIQSEMDAILKRHPISEFSEFMPDQWLDMLTVSGTPQDCAASIHRFVEAGADSIVFMPTQENELAQIKRLAADLLPLVRA